VAKLELTDAEADQLCELLDLDRESWEQELERIIREPFDSCEELLGTARVSQDAIALLKKVQRQLGGEDYD
jgi:hypothetical protein